MEKHESSRRISKVESTTDTLTGRGGLSLFVRYLSEIGIYKVLCPAFVKVKKRDRTCSLANVFKQVICFFMDGSSRHMSYFDELKKDGGYAAAIGNEEGEMVSSHGMKRFFKRLVWVHGRVFRKILRDELWVWRLRQEQPEQIVLTVDTMVMDNDEALKREGVQPTYKKQKGFQPLQLIWNGKIVDAVFRGGKKHSNHGNTVVNMLREVVKVIRTKYRADVPIIIRMDSGFLDEKILVALDELKVLWICSGKMYEKVKEEVKKQPEKNWQDYDNGRQRWSWVEFAYGCDSWEWVYRTIYTRPVYEEEQQLLAFARPDNVVLTNIDEDNPVVQAMPEAARKRWLQGETIVAMHHQRGADELPHRGLKDFGFEQLPFQRFVPNTAFYYCMVISFFLFETFKEDVLGEVISVKAYATTVRRLAVDFAAKIIRSGHQYILKVTEAVMERLRLQDLWERCAHAPPLRT